MRISDSMRYKLFQMNVSKVGQQLDDIEKKISTQKNINAPSDDPIKYTTNILYDAERSLGSQYNNNLQRLNTMISMYDVSFNAISSQLDDLSQLANNFGTLDQDLRYSAIEQVNGIIEQFVTIGNTKLGNSYTFGGQQADVPPFQLNNDYSVTFTVGQQGEDATKIFVDKAQTGQYGISGRQAFYGTSKIVFGDVTNAYMGDVYSNTDSFAYIINGTNNTIQMNGTAVTLTSGVYTGGSLAKEIERQLGTLYVVNDANNTLYRNGTGVTLTNGTYTGNQLAAEVATQLGAGYAAAYNGAGKTFSITNSTGADVTFNWSNAGATASDILGFNRQDAVVVNLGSDISDHSVASFMPVGFDSTTRKFLISNNTGGQMTFNWSNAGATAASVLGFDSIDSVIAAGSIERSDLDTGRKSFLVEITGVGGPTTGALGSRATYRYSTDEGATWTTGVTVNTGGADTTADITIDPTNNVMYRNGAALTLTNGTYTGETLAAEIQTQLNAVQAGHIVSYNALTRKIDITNNTGNVVTFNWSNAGSTAGGVLGYDNVDSVISNGTVDVSDYDVGMFIDGSGVINTTNNRVKLFFSTGTTDNLSAGDTFHVKDLSVFELLKNLKDAFESDNSTWISKNIQYIDSARSLTTKNNSIVAFQGTLANTLTENNKTKAGKIQALQADLVNADMSELATEFNVLLNTYQALLSTLARMQSVSILNYLK
jgi:flagellin-like hook-associated protein FlgL